MLSGRVRRAHSSTQASSAVREDMVGKLPFVSERIVAGIVARVHPRAARQDQFPGARIIAVVAVGRIVRTAGTFYYISCRWLAPRAAVAVRTTPGCAAHRRAGTGRWRACAPPSDAARRPGHQRPAPPE